MPISIAALADLPYRRRESAFNAIRQAVGEFNAINTSLDHLDESLAAGETWDAIIDILCSAVNEQPTYASAEVCP